jgi:hypothetical protein
MASININDSLKERLKCVFLLILPISYRPRPRSRSRVRVVRYAAMRVLHSDPESYPDVINIVNWSSTTTTNNLCLSSLVLLSKIAFRSASNVYPTTIPFKKVSLSKAF